MKVILKEDVLNLGRAGQTLSVKTGYARNYLFPKNLALPHKHSSAKELKHKTKLAELKAKKALKVRVQAAEQIKGKSFVFEKEVSDKGVLFGSVSISEIISTLKTDGFGVDKKMIKLESPIKTLGEHKVTIRFDEQSEAEITLVIQKKVAVSSATEEDSYSASEEAEEIEEDL